MMRALLLFTLISTVTLGQTPCDSGMAGVFPCDGYVLQSQIPLNVFNATSGNDSWGWTDPQDGKEYVLMGLNNGTAFVDISDPVNPIYLGKLPTHTDSSDWRDVKIYNNHAFVVSEAIGHGMQVFDLTRLRNVANPPEIFTEDAHYDGFGNAHNIAINESQALAYGLGTDTFSGGIHIVDISDPTNPTFAGGYATDGYSHDGQIVTYSGPDITYAGKEIYIGSNENEIVIVDVSDPINPIGISSISYNDIGYTHQGWFTEDQRYFIVGDELDEVFFGFPTRLIIMDLSELGFPSVHFEYTGTTDASDHNLYVKGNQLYLANYRGGMRVYDISDITNMNISEIGYFDTWPANDNVGASVGDPGAWNVFPFFDSDNIAISNYSDSGGLFIVKDENLLSSSDSDIASLNIFPNPAIESILVSLPDDVINSIALYDMYGKLIWKDNYSSERLQTIDISTLSSGIYLLRVNGKHPKKLVKL